MSASISPISSPIARASSCAFAASALTQTVRALAFAVEAPRTWYAVGHLGGLISALLVMLGLRVFLGAPLRCRGPVGFTVAVGVAANASQSGKGTE